MADAGNIFLGTPSHDSRVHFKVSHAAYHQLMTRGDLLYLVTVNSLLPYNCNLLLCSALNAREEKKIKYFGLLHSDIVPVGNGWLEKLIEIMARGYDLVSVLSPIKNDSGEYSAGWRVPVKKDGKVVANQVTKLTKAMVRDLPETFNRLDLRKVLKLPERFDFLLNTGLFLVDLQKEWSEKLFFRQLDGIIKTDKGRFVPVSESEDWFFTSNAEKLGARLAGTYEIELEHVGDRSYSNKPE